MGAFDEFLPEEFATNVEPEDELDREIRKLFSDEQNQITTETYELGKEIVVRQIAIKSVKEDITAATNRTAELDREENRLKAELRKKLEAIEEERAALGKKRQVLRRELAKLELELEQFKRRLELAIEKLMRSKSFLKMAVQFDEITAGLRWREFAYDGQIKGAQIAAHAKRAICGDKMGTGKTLTSLIYADMLQSQKLLIIAPGDVVRKFNEEVFEWAPHRTPFSIYKMEPAVRHTVLDALKTMDQFTVLVNYDIWRKDDRMIDKLIALGFDTVILDEAHNIKNTSTVAFQGVKRIVLAENACPNCNSTHVIDKPIDDVMRRTTRYCTNCKWDIRDRSDYKFGDMCSVKNVLPMTGTPVLNRPQELFPLLHLTMPHIFQTERDFLEIYCTQDLDSGYWYWRPGGLKKLTHHLEGRYFARSKEEMGITTPKQSVIPHYLEIDPEKYPLQTRIIKQLSKHAEFILDSGRKISALATITLILRKRQANVWPGGITLKNEDGDIVFSVGEEVNESIKVDKTVDMCEEFVSSNERVVVFSQFTGSITEVARRLNERGIKAIVFDGSTREATREAIRKDFSRKHSEVDGYEPRWDVVLCNYRTGGVGLDFTAATQTIVMDEEWNPGKNEQAWARTDRIGQTEENTVHILRLLNTIDDWIVRLNEHKRDVVGGFETSAASLADDMLNAMRNGEML